ncbi:MAG: HEAT repeat domain-containing protein, partial [Planctomycetota bacterium]
VEGKIISENEKSVTLEIGYGTITINRVYIKEVIAEEWTPPKLPKVLPPEEPVSRTEETKPVTPTPVSSIQTLLDSYAKNPKQKEINKIFVQILNLPEDNEPWQLFEELVSQSADETEYLLLLLKEIKEPAILKWVILSLGKLQVPAAVKPLFVILDGPDEMLKLVVLDALRYMTDISTTHLLRVQLPKEKSPKIKAAIINILFIAEDKESLLLLLDYLDDPDNEVRKAATNFIITVAQKSTADELRSIDLMGRLKDKMLSTRQKETREEIISIFGKLKSPEAVEVLMSFLTDENAEIRSEAAMALGSIGDKKATNFLLERLQKEEDEWTKMQIIGALQNTNDSLAIPAIIEMLRDDKEKVRLCAARALRNMTRQSFGEDYGKWKEWWEKEQAK